MHNITDEIKINLNEEQKRKKAVILFQYIIQNTTENVISKWRPNTQNCLIIYLFLFIHLNFLSSICYIMLHAILN